MAGMHLIMNELHDLLSGNKPPTQSAADTPIDPKEATARLVRNSPQLVCKLYASWA